MHWYGFKCWVAFLACLGRLKCTLRLFRDVKEMLQRVQWYFLVATAAAARFFLVSAWRSGLLALDLWTLSWAVTTGCRAGGQPGSLAEDALVGEGIALRESGLVAAVPAPGAAVPALVAAVPALVAAVPALVAAAPANAAAPSEGGAPWEARYGGGSAGKIRDEAWVLEWDMSKSSGIRCKGGQ